MIKNNIKTCLIKLIYWDKSSGTTWERYHVTKMDLDESVEDQVYKKFGSLTPTFSDFKWTEVNI